ncbi:MAG TPA: cation:proton antiporter [Crocinitomicaceae bacterium]|nr:cation:proton antiporter [Crocinitomicaceae bacterium]
MIEFFQHFAEAFQLPLQDNILMFSLILLIILLSPIILKKLNIPGIIGLIIAGIAIGPHGFNVIEKNSAVDLFSLIGLLYIMFIAGLELDLNEFKANKNKSFVFGFLTFAIPLAFGFPFVHYFLGYDFNTSFLTASMFATHTLVAYPIVSKLGVSKNQAVAVTVGGTILTDTAVLIILAVIIGNAHGSLNSAFWIKLIVSLAIFSAIMFLIIPRIAKWFFRKLESEKHSHYIFVLSVVFFAGFLAEVAGVEPIIGAFVAGLALNKLIPHSSALMNRIEFMGNALFIPFFLISVGMIVDVRVIMSGWNAWIVAGTLTLVAIFGKWLAAWFTQLVFKYTGAQRQLIFGLSSAHAAATLAIILVGYNTITGTDTSGNPIRLLDENILNGTIILILITCIVASFATEKAAKKILIESEKESAEIPETSWANAEQILIPIDNVSKVKRILNFATLIRNKKSNNPISVLTVVSNNSDAELNIVRAKSKLEENIKEASATDTKTKVLTTIDHNIASGIARVSREIVADVIILGWPHVSNFLDKLTGEKIDGILSSTYKTAFVCNLIKPLATQKRIVMIVPPLAEFEKGFGLWLEKMTTLAQELSIPMVFYGTEATGKAIEKTIADKKYSAVFSFIKFDEWEDILVLSKDIHKDDLFILVTARRGATSYTSIFENLPSKMAKYLPNNNLIVIYSRHIDELTDEGYNDISSEPITKTIEVAQKLGKEIGSIFKKKEE